MLKRTHITAWVFMAISAYAFLFLLLFIFQAHNALGKYLLWQTMLWALQWPCWIGLLKKRKQSWAALVIIFALIGLGWILKLVQTLVYFPSNSELHPSLMVNLVSILATLLLESGLPLWILLTDKPSQWINKEVNSEPTLNVKNS